MFSSSRFSGGSVLIWGFGHFRVIVKWDRPTRVVIGFHIYGIISLRKVDLSPVKTWITLANSLFMHCQMRVDLPTCCIMWWNHQFRLPYSSKGRRTGNVIDHKCQMAEGAWGMRGNENDLACLHPNTSAAPSQCRHKQKVHKLANY